MGAPGPPPLPSQSSLERSASTFPMSQASCPLPFSSWSSHPLSSSSVSSLSACSFLSARKNSQQPPAASLASPRPLSSPSWEGCSLQRLPSCLPASPSSPRVGVPKASQGLAGPLAHLGGFQRWSQLSGDPRQDATPLPREDSGPQEVHPGHGDKVSC